VCLHIPIHISNAEHHKMFLEKKKLFQDLIKMDIDVVFTLDKCEDRLDISGVPVIDMRKEGKSTGIVRATKKAMSYFKERYGDDCFIMRTGQDVKIDLEGIWNHINWLQGKNFDDTFLAGGTDRHNDIFEVLKEIGINEKKRVFEFIQGNFMSAPMKMWDKYYNNLPPSVVHYKDDSCMSFMLDKDGGKLEKINKFWDHSPAEYFDKHVIQGKALETLYKEEKSKASDVKNLLGIYEKYAKKCDSITEFRRGNNPTSLCFAVSRPKKLCLYNESGFVFKEEVGIALSECEYVSDKSRSLTIEIDETDLLHLDTKHNYDRVLSELKNHHSKVKKYILIHDYYTFGDKGDDGRFPGIKKAVSDFIDWSGNGWKIIEENSASNGLVVLEKSVGDKKSTTKKHAMFIYRYHAKKEDKEKEKYLDEFTKQYRSFVDKERKNIPAYLIIDNSSKDVIDRLTAKYSDCFQIIITNSKEQKERLDSGKPCSSQRYTFYISSMQIIKEHADDDTIIFFCEDDYLYRPDAFGKVCSFLLNHPNDFVSMYDHPDRYADASRIKEVSGKYSGYKLELLWEASHHWRTSISTCHSFATTKKALALNAQFTIKANVERRDHLMWCEIWKLGKSKLYGAIPGLASHRQGPHLDDWDWSIMLRGNRTI